MWHKANVYLALALLLSSDPTCAQVLKNVQRVLKPHTIAFGTKCEVEATGAPVLGDIDGTKVAVIADGPGGSGHYWQINVTLDPPAGRTICIDTSTIAWRNVASTNLFPVYEPLGIRHRFQLWSSINSVPPEDDTADMAPTMLLLPAVYRLGRDGLALDVPSTKQVMKKFAALYEKASTRSSAKKLHGVAAIAYAAYAEGSSCP